MDTFDIDKVLDDFEEREALQVKQIERTESNVENWQPWKSTEGNHVITLEKCHLNQSPYIPLETTLYPFYVQNDNQGSTLVQSEMGPSNEIVISQSDFPSTLKNYPSQEILKNLNVNSLCYETVEQHRCNSLDRDIPNLLDKVAAVATENIGVPVASNKTHIVALSVEEKDHETKEYKFDSEVLNISVKNSNLSESNETVFHSSVSNDCCLTEFNSPTVLDACSDSENCNIYKIQISEHDKGSCKNLLDDRSDFSSEGSFFNALSVKCEKSVTDSNYVVDTSNIEKEVCSEINGTQNSEILELDFSESFPVYNMIEDDINKPFCNKLDYNENSFKKSEQQNWKSTSHEALMQDLVLQQNNSVLQNGNRCNESQPNTKLGPNNAVVVEVVCDNFSAKKLQFEKTFTKQYPTEPAYEKEPNYEISANVSSICKPIGFSDNEEDESLDVAVINDYLGDVSEGHLIQDEDSGVSSQEGDINGNNMLPYASNKCDREASEHYSKTIDLKNDEPFNMVPITENNEVQESIYGNFCASEKSYIVKKYNNVIEKNIFNADTFERDLTEEESIYCGARPKQKENNAVEPVTSDNIDSSGKSAVLLENMDTQHSDANDDPRTDNYSITLEKRDIDENCYISNCSELDYVQEFGDENNVDSFSGDNKFNAINCSENSDCSIPRLQRPTTLDLPSRSIMKPFDDCTDEDDSALPSCDSIVDDTSERLLISNEQSMLDDSSHTGDQSIMQCDILNEVEQPTQLGIVKPFWIPDAAAPNCMHCQIKFSMFKRRHHCRACGKVLCARCCYQKAPLAYLQNKEDRVCEQCFVIVLNASKLLSTVSGESPSSSSCGSSPNFSPTSLADHYSPKSPHRSPWRPHPNNPDDYCSTVPPLQQAHQSLNCPPPTVMVPIGVLKRGNKPRGEPKQVIFSDGIRPGGDLTDLTESVENVLPYRRQGGRRRVDKAVTILTESSLLSCNGIAPVTANKKLPHPKNRHKRVIVSDSEGPLPPILLPLETVADLKPDMDMLLSYLQDAQKTPVVFAPTKNMHILTKIAKLDCCFGKECWCFTSHGLCAVGQDEVMVILERLKDENTIPRDIFKLYVTIYGNASKGSTVGELGHVVFPEGILGRLEPAGFLFVRPTFQCLSNLVVPNTPFLVAILIQKWEIPWAKVFPLRLMLRFGAESRYYPCSLLSNRDRNPVYSEIGRTIIKCLADFKNYQFTLPVIPGLVIHVEDKKTYINIPRNRYEKVLKVINSNTEHVLSLGSNFSSEADSHLVCMQKDEENYETQAINIGNTPRRVIGASFIIFSGALKSSLGLTAKFSVLEDGLFVEILPETMAALHSALTDMRDLIIPCGEINTAEVEAVVTLQWTRDDRKFNLGVRSSVDDRSLEGVQSVRIHNFSGYEGEHYLIRWTEVFFIELDENENSRRNDGVDPSRLAEAVARACCMSLTPYLDQLADADFTKIGLRVTLDSEGDKVEYEVGSRGKSLPSVYMNVLDNGLIPVISRLSGSSQDGPISLELIFHILIK